MTSHQPGPRPAKFGRADAHYDADYHRAFHGEMLAAEDHYKARAQLSADLYFTAAERSQRVFEYGCGVGQNIAALPRAGGWDISQAAINECRARGLNVYDDWASVPRASWDVVLCRHVLEHLEDPLAALRRMRELLAPEGKLILVVPKEAHLREPLRPDFTQHLFAWNFLTINNLLFRAGYRPTFNGYNYPIGWLAFMPIRRLMGHAVYSAVSRAGRVLRRNGELVVHALRDEGSAKG